MKVEKIKKSINLLKIIKFDIFWQIFYSLRKQTNQNSEIVALINPYSASLQIFQILIF